MTTDNRSPAEIENEIERERAELASTLNTLQSKFSVEGVARQLSDQFREHGGDIGKSVSDAVKRNPVALALTGAGLAWLMLGDKTGNRDNFNRRYSRVDHNDRYDNDHVDLGEHGERDGLSNSAYPPSGFTGRKLGPQPGDPSKPYYSGRTYQSDDTPTWARSHDDDHSSDAGETMRDAAGKVADGVSHATSSTADAARNAGSAVASTASNAAGSIADAGKATVGAAQSFASGASDRASRMRARLAEGTESLSEEARNKVIAARERAIKARDAAADYGRQGQKKATDMFEDQPLIAGALAIAVGAAIGAALPRSRTEDAYMGEHRDNLMHEAERVFQEEKEKLSKVAKAATDEAKQVGEEIKKNADDAAPAETAMEAVANKAKSTGKRITDAAKAEAKKQNVGSVTKS